MGESNRFNIYICVCVPATLKRQKRLLRLLRLYDRNLKTTSKDKMLKSTLIFREGKICRTFAPEISKRAAISFQEHKKYFHAHRKF